MQQTTDKPDLPVWDMLREPVVEIETGGDVIKPFLHSARQLVDECKIRFDSDGLSITAVDPANAGMVDLSLPADGFDSYEIDCEFVTGVSLKRLKSATRRARVAHDDTLSLSVSSDEFRATVARGYDECDVVSNDGVRAIDPDAIRQEPNVPHLRDNDEYHTVTLSANAFADGIDHVLNQSEYIDVESDGGDMLISGKTDGDKTAAVRYNGIGGDTDGVTPLSGHYIQTMLDIIDKAQADTVEFSYAPEMPALAEFSTEHLTGMYMVAPRVRSE